jgi:hypothetical protein
VSRLRSRLVAFTATVVAMLGSGMMGALADETPREVTVDPDAWRFRATAYGWLMSVSGNVTAHGQTGKRRWTTSGSSAAMRWPA